MIPLDGASYLGMMMRIFTSSAYTYLVGATPTDNITRV